MALTGHLNDLSLSELIEFFCNQRKTGQLKVLYPQGHGYFFLQSGSVVDARIGVLRGIDAVYYSLTLPSAKFEFSGSAEPGDRSINQPWTQVVLEGLRRLDEGIAPPCAFPDDYVEEKEDQDVSALEPEANLEDLRVPSFLSFMSKESFARRRYFVAGAAAIAVVMSVAAVGVPAGWYARKENTSAVLSQPASPAPEVTQPAEVVPEAPKEEASESTDNAAALAAKRQRDKEKAAAVAREERLAAHNQTTPATNNTQVAPQPVVAKPATQPEKPSGPKKITVTVTYDESGRVTQASGGDASAVRIARQKRFPAGKAGSATITIPVN